MRAESKQTETPRRQPDWRMLVAVVWLVGFLLFFFTRPMPNLGGTFAETRFGALKLVPLVLLDWVFPDEPEPQATPGIRSGWRYLPERLAIWSLAGLILAGAWGIGHWLLAWLVSSQTPSRTPLPQGERALEPLERFVFALGVGLSCVSLLTLGSGVLGFLNRGFFTIVLGGSFLSALAYLFRNRPVRKAARFSENPLGWRWVLLALLVPFLVVMLLGGVSPSTDFDVKEYHFGGPKEFFLKGRVEFLAHNVYTSFPFLTEMFALLGMVLKIDWAMGALVGKSVLMAFVPLTGLAILAAGRRWFGNLAGWLGMLIWISTPWATRIAIIAYAEGGLTCYLFLAFFAALIATGRLREGKLDPGLFLLAGLLAGSAMACKYTGLVYVVFPLALLVGWTVLRAGRIESPGNHKVWLKTLGAFGLGVVVTIGAWLIKNLTETGNPVYPLAWSIFGGRDWDAGLNARWTKAHSPPHHDVTSLVVWENGSPGWLFDVTAVNDWLSPLIYGLAPLVFLLPGVRRFAGGIWIYLGWLFIAWWALTHRLDRFWVPMLPVAAMLAGAGATWSSDRLWRMVLGAAMGITLVFNFVLIGTQNAGYVAWLSNLKDAQAFTARVTAPEIEYLNNRVLPEIPEMRVLSVGDAEVFDARFPVVYNTVFDRSIFQEWTERPGSDLPPEESPMQSAEAIRKTFQEEGITHVLVNWQEILRYRPTYGYAEFVTPKRFDELVDMGVLEVPRILGRRSWEELNSSEKKVLNETGWRELLEYENTGGEEIVLSAVYRVRNEAWAE